jgi:hypothetical protein
MPEEPQHLCLEEGYDDDEVREPGKEFGSTLPIRHRKEEARAIKRQIGWKRAPVGGGTNAQLDEPLSQHLDPLSTKRSKIMWVCSIWLVLL